MIVKFHFHANEHNFRTILNENIDTLVGLNEEVIAEGFDYHEKKYRGVVRDNFFETKSKFIIGVLRTYNPWTIRGDFKSVGSNVELTLSMKRSKSLHEVLQLLVMIPLIIAVISLSNKDTDANDLAMFCIGIAVPISYHLISRWIQFTTLRHFFQLISKTTTASEMPN